MSIKFVNIYRDPAYGNNRIISNEEYPTYEEAFELRASTCIETVGIVRKPLSDKGTDFIALFGSLSIAEGTIELQKKENKRLKSRIKELESQIETQRKEEKDKIFLSASVIASGIVNRHGIADTPVYAVKVAKGIHEEVYGRAEK